MRHETVSLSVPGAQGATELITYVPDNFPEMGIDRIRPALIICPGGRYEYLSDREGEPVALRFAGLGYATFLLRYHTAPKGRWPIPQRQVLCAVDHVRSNCSIYHVDPGSVVVMGFSAGGHLAGCAALLWNRPEFYHVLPKRAVAYRPDGAVLCYPVVTSGKFANRASFVNLLGDRYEELIDEASLEKRAKRSAPPVFLWHTADDLIVPVENSLMLSNALKARGVEVEMHIYPHGRHGQSLADRTVYAPSKYLELSPACAVWVTHCNAWLQRNFGFH